MAIQNRSKRNEVLGNFIKKEDEALTTAFGSRGKRRLIWVFDAIGFVHPEYLHLTQSGWKKKKASSKQSADTPKQKRVKITTKR